MEASALSAPAGLSRLTVAGRLLRLRSDEQLVALFRAGHEEAFRVIHDRYRQRLHAYARQMLGGSLPDAEDVLQDVFLRAYHALRVDDRPVSLRAWLYRVAHNRCIDQLRRPAPAPADVLDLNRTPQHDPLDEAQRRDQLRRLVADLHRLPGQQRSALLLREMEGLSYAELAAALDVSVPAIKSLLVRARIGLVQASEARDSACPDIRAHLAAAHDGRARLSGVARRHVRECDGCRDYRRGLRTTSRSLAGLHPAGPLTVVAKLLGAGGAGSAGGGAVTVLGGGATATKVVAVVCCAAVVGGGAAEVREIAADRAPAQRSAPAQAAAAPVAAAPPAAARAPDPAPAAAPAVRRSRDRAKLAPSRSAGEMRRGGATLAPTAAAAMPTEIEMRSGGVAAPEAQAPAASEPAGQPPAHGDTPGTALGEGLALPAIGNGSGSSEPEKESASHEQGSGSASGSASGAEDDSQPASEGGAGGAAPGGDGRP